MPVRRETGSTSARTHPAWPSSGGTVASTWTPMSSPSGPSLRRTSWLHSLLGTLVMACLGSSPTTPSCGSAWKTLLNTTIQKSGATRVPVWWPGCWDCGANLETSRRWATSDVWTCPSYTPNDFTPSPISSGSATMKSGTETWASTTPTPCICGTTWTRKEGLWSEEATRWWRTSAVSTVPGLTGTWFKAQRARGLGRWVQVTNRASTGLLLLRHRTGHFLVWQLSVHARVSQGGRGSPTYQLGSAFPVCSRKIPKTIGA